MKKENVQFVAFMVISVICLGVMYAYERQSRELDTKICNEANLRSQFKHELQQKDKEIVGLNNGLAAVMRFVTTKGMSK